MNIAPQIDPEILDRIVATLSNLAGIDPSSLQDGRIAWTIERRRKHLRLTDARAYVDYAESTPEELEELIDALVIQETRFFRDPAVFEHLRTWARDAANGHGMLRVLSAPCSTGQEAYSIAAMLTLTGIPPERFHIDAFDISHSALAAARRGVYPASALNLVKPELQQACGRVQCGHWHMHEELRRRIRFERRNLSESGALESGGRYQLILCRNLIIYLNARVRAVLAESLSRALMPAGLLIVGAGDRVAELNARFAPVKPASGFGFVHNTNTACIDEQTTSEPRKPAAVPIKPRLPELSLPVVVAHDDVTRATAADFYYRAVEYQQRGNVRQAERRCRQALYLAPEYLPALELLQVLWHGHPNARLGQALTARIQRVRMELVGERS